MLDVTFDEPLRHVAEQQALVLYDGEVCLGTADIVARGPSLHDEQLLQQRHCQPAEPSIDRGGR